MGVGSYSQLVASKEGETYGLPIDQFNTSQHMVQKQQMGKRNRARDFCLYVLISMFFVGIAAYAAMGDVRWDLFMRWFAFAFLTFFLFGFFIESSRSLWKQRSFWLWTSALLCVHSAVLLLLLRGTTRSGGALGLAFIVEGTFMAAFRKWKYPDSAMKATTSP